MGLYDYRRALTLNRQDEPFHALVMAAIMRADTYNLEALGRAFPELVREVRDRYHAAGGVLPGEPGYEEIQRSRAEIGMPPT